MINFIIPQELDQSKVFLMPLSRLEGRLDPNTYHIDRLSAIEILRSSGVSLRRLKSLVSPSRETIKEFPSSDTVYVGLENIESNSGDYLYTSEKETVSSAILFYKGDILFPKLRPYLNKVFYATFDGICSTEFHVFKSDILDNEYLAYFLGLDLVVRQTKRLMSGNTLPRLQTEDIYNLLIPVISRNQQNIIVDLMSAAKTKRAKKQVEARFHLDSIDEYLLLELGIVLPKKNISIENRIFTTSFKQVSGKRFDPKLFEAYSQNLFLSIEHSSFPKLPLKKLLIQSIAGDWGVEENSFLASDDFSKCLVIRATEFDNLYNLKLENDRVKYRWILNDKLEKLDIRANDLLIEKSGGSPDQPVGRIAIITSDLIEGNTLCYSNFIHKIRVDETKVSPEYLFCFLKTIHNIKVTEIMQSQTNGIRNLIMSEYLNQSIVLPPMELQKDIAREANMRRFEAQRLTREASLVLRQAKGEVEEIILTS